MGEINLRELLLMFLRKWWLLLIGVVLSGGIAYAWMNYYMVPIYSSYTTLFVGKNLNQNGVSSNNLNLGSNLIQDYREIDVQQHVNLHVIVTIPVFQVKERRI